MGYYDTWAAANVVPKIDHVRSWVAKLTVSQEINYDAYPKPAYDDPQFQWALLDLDTGKPIRLIPDVTDEEHSAISDYLSGEEAARRLVGVMCGHYRHPDRAKADRAERLLQGRVNGARDSVVDPAIEALSALAIELHAIDPRRSVATYLRDIAGAIDTGLGARADLERYGGAVDPGYSAAKGRRDSVRARD